MHNTRESAKQFGPNPEEKLKMLFDEPEQYQAVGQVKTDQDNDN